MTTGGAHQDFTDRVRAVRTRVARNRRRIAELRDRLYSMSDPAATEYISEHPVLRAARAREPLTFDALAPPPTAVPRGRPAAGTDGHSGGAARSGQVGGGLGRPFGR